MQVQLQVHVDQPDLDGSASGAVDEIDAALTDLQVSLEGSSTSAPSDITKIPELQDELRFFKPKKFTFKSFKRYFFTFRDTCLSMYRSANEADQPPLLKLNLKGCEVTPDVNISAQRYNMKLFVTTTDGMTECWLRAFTEEQYANWMAAFRLASKGKTMADSVAYDQEKSSIQVFLSMQHPVPVTSVITSPSDFQPEDFVAPRFIRKLKSKQVAQRILEAHANVREMNLMESKLRYIKAWQALPEYGITYFICRFVNPHKGELSKKEELLGIASNRMLRMDLNTGDTLKTLRFPELKTWSVNWEIKQVRVTFELENIDFQCVTADCKVVHEFIGGYIFLSMRSGDKNQALNEELFHKLTGGWD
ncbi:hypothetical protein LSH36_154g13036 [Paralvinella palmiformis]|uniref:PH domain-containing protein n=1 Tax=Paralvinella palmiformis TaxID=53620 RepID=A0AAD9JVV0_9ANNE|nr:hypothetical protein LSH36_154g13036 [Paralvinella palmiformis]